MTDSVKRIKRQATEQEKIFTKHISENRLVSRTNAKLNKKQTTRKYTKNQDKYFTIDIQHHQP